MTELLPFIVAGVATGSLYGLAGVGLVLTYRTSGVFNFGHGTVAAGAAFLFYTLHVEHGVAWPVAAVITIGLFAGVVGVSLERLTRNLAGAPPVLVVVATVGLLLAIQGFLYIQYGAVTRGLPDFLPRSGFEVGGVNISWSQTISVLLATACVAALYVFLRTSLLGISMRAVVDNAVLVGLSGQEAVRIRRAAWSIGTAFAALSGILLAPILGLDATLLTLLVVQAFGACAVGRFSSLPLTYVGGLLVGVLASVATRYFTGAPFNGVPSSVPFLVLLVVLLVVPSSRFPSYGTNIGSLLVERASISRRTTAVVGLGGGLFFAAVPMIVGTKLPVWINGLTYLILFGSLSLLVWTSGQISLCHASFVAVGATTMAHLAGAGLPWVVALTLAGVLTVPVGAVVAIPAIRLSGIYLALATLGFSILMQNVVFSSGLMFGPRLVVTAPRPRLDFLNGSSDTGLYYVVLAVVVAAFGSLLVLSRTRIGRLLRAMAETPTMLTTQGLSVNVTRLLVFCISAFFAGIAGALLITQSGSASGMAFGPIQSLLLLAVVAACGTDLLRSSLIAAGLYAVAPGYLTSIDLDSQTFGFGLLALSAALVVNRRAVIAAHVAAASRRSEGRFEGRAARRAPSTGVPDVRAAV